MTPVTVLGVSNGVIRRVIEVNGQHNLLSRVFGQAPILLEGRIGRISGTSQPTGGIVAAGCANGIHEHLVPLIQDVALLLGIVPEICAPAPAAVVDFIETFHNEPVFAVLELIGNLGPDRFDLGLDGLVLGAVISCILDILPLIIIIDTVILVVVGIDNNLKASRMGKAHHLVDAVHPGLVNLVIRGGANHLEPGDGNADTGKAQVLNTIKGGLGSFIGLPGRLVGIAILLSIVVEGVEVISHIPAKAQGFDKLPVGVLSGLRFFSRRLGKVQRGRSGTGGLEGKGGGAGFEGCVAGHRNSTGNRIIFQRAEAHRNPVRFFHLGHEGSLDRYLEGFSFGLGRQGGSAQGNGRRGLGRRIGRGLRILFISVAAAHHGNQGEQR